MMTDDTYGEMESVVGEENVSREPAILDSYAFQSFHRTEPGSWVHRPVAVVLPGTTGEVQQIVKICNRNKVSYKAHSTGWGAHSGPGKEGVLQIDLRRMDRVLEIDEENMYVVVEPYAICAQVQAELMKHGLNLHIIGAGSSTSPLAACTSHMGMGWSGVSMGYSGRSVLGVEWVLPDGELLRLGSLGSGSGWFCGDGPGPSLRGIMRGWAGYDGGLGVFTGAAIKTFNWPGPPEPEVEGLLFDAKTEVPDNFKVYMCFFPDYERWADAYYKIGEAEITYIMAKNPIGAALWAFAPHLARKIADMPALKTALKAAQHGCQLMVAANSTGDLEYQEKTLRKIIDETEGVLLEAFPPFESMIWWSMVRVSIIQAIFRPGGNFFVGFGGDESVDNTVLQAKFGEKIKQDFIDKGLIYDDLADVMWGGLYEQGLFNHQEEVMIFNARDPRQAKAPEEFAKACARTAVEEHLGGIGFALFGGEKMHDLFSPVTSDYYQWEKKIKETWDPDDLSNQTFR